MKEDYPYTIPGIFRHTLERYPESFALGFAGETPLTYREVNERLLSVMSFLEKNKIVPGNKVAILSTNMPNWGITYLAITGMGAVIVPILPDFSTTEIENVLTHSGAKAVFVSSNLLPKIEGIKPDT